MRKKVIFGFLLFCLVLPLVYARGNTARTFDRYEEVIYRVDDAFISIIGRAADGAHFLVDFFLSFDVTGERWNVDLQAMIAENHLRTVLWDFADEIFFPMFKTAHLVEILGDEENTMFSDGFMDYIKDNEDLSNTRVTRVRIELVSWAR